MAKELTWDDAEDIGVLLSEKYPQVNPVELPYADLHHYVTELSEFSDDSKKSPRGKLESIQMAWHAEFLDRTQG